MHNVKYMVRHVLEEDEKTRSDDKWLVLQVLRSMGFKIYIEYEQVAEIPSFESITRARRHWQAKGEFPPDEETAKRRRRNQQEMKGIKKWY